MKVREGISQIIDESEIGDEEWLKGIEQRIGGILDQERFPKEPFRLAKLGIRRFGADIYCGISDDISYEGSTLIWGEHRTGKSTTYDGILYGLLGPKGPLRSDLGNPDVSLVLSNGSVDIDVSRVYGKGITVKVDKRTYEGQEASQALERYTGLRPEEFIILRALFLPQRSEIDSTLLRIPNPRDFALLIERFTSDRRTSFLKECIRDELEKVGNELSIARNKLGDIDYQVYEINQRIGSTNYYANQLTDFVESYESGKFKQIIEELNENPEIREELRELENEFQFLWQEESRLKHTIGTVNRKYLDKNPEEVVENVLFKVCCPVCAKNIELETVRTRLERKSRCPLCNATYSWEIFSKAEERIEEARNIGKLKDRLKEIQRRKEEIEKRKKELNIEYGHETIRRATRGKISKKQYKETLTRLEDAKKLIQDDRERLGNLEKVYETLSAEGEVLQHKEALLEEIEQLIYRTDKPEDIEGFLAEATNRFYNRITQDDTVIEIANGDIFLVEKFGNEVRKRNARDRYEISMGERRALDVSLVLSLVLLNEKRRFLNINFTVLDDVTEGILGKLWKKNLFSVLEEISKAVQLVLTSYDTDLRESMRVEKMTNLIRQRTLPEFSQSSPSGTSS